MNKIDKINKVIKDLELTSNDQDVRENIDECTINEIKDCVLDLYHALQDIRDIILFRMYRLDLSVNKEYLEMEIDI